MKRDSSGDSAAAATMSLPNHPSRERFMTNHEAYVGFDVHKETIAVAIAVGGPGGDAFSFGTIKNSKHAIGLLAKKLARTHDKLSFCYEAGPCGYAIYRQLVGLGHACQVVAPSLIPTKPGDHIKTDHRDAMTLARLLRAGELTAVWVPDQAHEAMRDLVRGRIAVMESVRKARQQLQGFLLRQDLRYSGKTSWTSLHSDWLRSLTFEYPAHHVLVQELLYVIEEGQRRQQRIEQQIEALLPTWSMAPIISAIQALRGVSLIAALILAAEIGDFRRFNSPRQLMAYLGLVPSEFSSGKRVTRGSITKAGSARARRVLIEGAWAYQRRASVSKRHMQRLLNLPARIREIAWDAQLRLCGRYRRLAAKGRCKNVITTAIAREMAAFVWAIAREVEPAPIAA